VHVSMYGVIRKNYIYSFRVTYGMSSKTRILVAYRLGAGPVLKYTHKNST
jgi:Na+-driven multidrug efflux pump